MGRCLFWGIASFVLLYLLFRAVLRQVIRIRQNHTHSK